MNKTIFKAQPYLSKQCGQTCIAMITGKSIEEVCREMDKKYTTNIFNDLQNYLDKEGYKTLVSYGEMKIEEVPNNSIIRLNKPDNSGHYVLKTEEGKIYDPAVGIIEKYLNHSKISHYLSFSKA